MRGIAIDNSSRDLTPGSTVDAAPATCPPPAKRVLWDVMLKVGPDTQHERMRNGALTQRTPRVWSVPKQEIIIDAIGNGTEGVEVGVHRGRSVGGVTDTVDLDPSAQTPPTTTQVMESIIKWY